MTHVPDIKSKDIEVRLLSELPDYQQDADNKAKSASENQRSLYKQLQEEFRYL